MGMAQAKVPFASAESDNGGLSGGAAAALASAVILQAIKDAKPYRKFGGATGRRSLDASQAMSFLTAPDGAWAQARCVWCDMADLDPEELRERAECGSLWSAAFDVA